MNIVTKVIGKLYKNFNVLIYSLFISTQTKVNASKSFFIWHRAIAISCGVYPIYFPKRREITDTFLGNMFLLTRFFVWMSYRNINEKLRKNNSVYVSLTEMETFTRRVLPKIKIPFVLVTGDSDYSTSKFKEILNNKYLLHWFAQNNDIDSDKTTALPIGLDLQSLVTQPWTGEKMKSAFVQENILNDIIQKDSKKRLKIFSNFQLSNTNPRRKELYNLLKNNSIYIFKKLECPELKCGRFRRNLLLIFLLLEMDQIVLGLGNLCC